MELSLLFFLGGVSRKVKPQSVIRDGVRTISNDRH